MNWFVDTFLPMWAKETVLKENRQLRRENRQLQYELDRLRAYVRGLERGIRHSGKERNS